MGWYRNFFTGFSLALLCNAALADEQHITNRFSGFATIGAVTNDNSDLVYRRDISQRHGSIDGDVDWRTDSLLGLQLQTQWSYQLETTAQLVLKDRIDNTLNDSVEWAFARYRPMDGLDLRVGRLGSDIFMLSDYRQVGYALPWIRPPEDTYGKISFYHFDGVDINKRFNIDDGTLNIKAFYGKSDQEYPVGIEESANYRLSFKGFGTSINWEKNEWKLRYSYADVEIRNNNDNPLIPALNSVSMLWPQASALAADFYTKSKYIKYHELGLGYDNNSWWIQTEVTLLNSDAKVVSNSHTAYLSVGKRIDAFTLYTIAGFTRTNEDAASVVAPAGYPAPIEQQLQALAYGTELAINGGRSDQHSYCVGARWDFTSKMALKLQVQRFYIDKYGDSLWLKSDNTLTPKDRTANVVSVSWDLLF